MKVQELVLRERDDFSLSPTRLSYFCYICQASVLALHIMWFKGETMPSSKFVVISEDFSFLVDDIHTDFVSQNDNCCAFIISS